MKHFGTDPKKGWLLATPAKRVTPKSDFLLKLEAAQVKVPKPKRKRASKPQAPSNVHQLQGPRRG